jgi:hypothetical protein
VDEIKGKSDKEERRGGMLAVMGEGLVLGGVSRGKGL